MAVVVAVLFATAGCSDGSGAASDGDDGSRAAEATSGDTARGAEVVKSYSCTNCHSTDGSRGTGPTWKGIWGEQAELSDGRTLNVDDAYVRRSITDPSADVVDGFSPIMPTFNLSEDELDAITAYIRSLGQ